MEKKEITIEIKHPEIFLLLIILAVFLYFQLQVSLNSPISFGDEGFHARAGQYIAEEKEFPVWIPYTETPVNKQGLSGFPFWWLLQAGFYLILGFNINLIKFLTPFMASFLVGIVVFLLGKRIYNKEIGFMASIIAISIPSLVTYSVLLYKDSLFTLYFSLFVLSIILAIKTDQKKYFILSSVFAPLALLAKTPGWMIFPTIALAFLYEVYNKKSFFKPLKKYIVFLIFLLLILGPLSIREWVYYHTPSCSFPFFDTSGCFIFTYKDSYEFAGRTEEVGTEVNFLRMGVINYLDFAYGIIWFVPLTFICGLFIILKRLEKSDISIILIIISSLPLIYMTYWGRSEDFARYTQGLAAIVGLVSAVYLREIYDFVRKHLKQISIIIFILVISLSYLNLTTKLYAARHYDEGSGRYVGYKMFSPLFFEACDWVKQNLDENVRLGSVIWGSATMFNCQRNAGGGGADVTLSNNLTLALSVLKMQEVTHIFITKFSISWTDQKLSERYPISYVSFLEDNPEYFKKVFENGPPLQQCMQMGGCDGTIIYEIDYIKFDETS